MPSEAGVTLVELLITVTILAILATSVTAGYGKFMQETRRADAVLGLLEMASAAERTYLSDTSYTRIEGEVSRHGHYKLTLSVVDDGQVFTARAIPVEDGPQAGDACAEFWLDSHGRRGVSGTKESVEQCWKQ